MIVEDEDDIRNMLEYLLTQEGYEITTAKNGQDLLDTVDQIQPDLITLDAMMPGLHIKEILQKLQNKESTPQIILLTVLNYSNDEINTLAQYGNIVEYIHKPFNIQHLIQSIKTHLA
jgi:DNA-binding response OmpR family regulator